MDFIEVYGEVISYNNALQLNIRQIRKAAEGEYTPADYMPSTEKDPEAMYQELLAYGRQVKNPYLRGVIEYYFEKDPDFIRKFRNHSAAKTVHHGFAGGLLETYVKRGEILRIYGGGVPHPQQGPAVYSRHVPRHREDPGALLLPGQRLHR